MPSPLPDFLPLLPRAVPRVWGGQRLAPERGEAVGELWLADGESEVASGPLAGQRVGDVLQREPALLGQAAHGDGSFPLLVKLLDCQDWLSLQVHPDDAQARALHGPGARGKCEAWHFLEVAPPPGPGRLRDVHLVAGVRPDTTPQTLRTAIETGHLLDLVEGHRVAAGDSVNLPAGTLHALGPGLFLYELQQASDLTYRAYDWDRPAHQGRALHLPEVAAVSRVDCRPTLQRGSATGGLGELAHSPYFVLHGVAGGERVRSSGGIQIVTVVEGELTLRSATEELRLSAYDTALVPATTLDYQFEGRGRALIAQAVQAN